MVKRTWKGVSVRKVSDPVGGFVSIRAENSKSGARVKVMLYGTGRVGVRFGNERNVTIGQDGLVVE